MCISFFCSWEKRRVVYRGTSERSTRSFENHKTNIWSEITSCSTDIGVPQMFGGTHTGRSAMLCIETSFCKDIRSHSAFPDECEVILALGLTSDVRSHHTEGGQTYFDMSDTHPQTCLLPLLGVDPPTDPTNGKYFTCVCEFLLDI